MGLEERSLAASASAWDESAGGTAMADRVCDDKCGRMMGYGVGGEEMVSVGGMRVGVRSTVWVLVVVDVTYIHVSTFRTGIDVDWSLTRLAYGCTILGA